jgi:N-acetylmuramoyl-L-alanine amidase
MQKIVLALVFTIHCFPLSLKASSDEDILLPSPLRVHEWIEPSVENTSQLPKPTAKDFAKTKEVFAYYQITDRSEVKDYLSKMQFTFSAKEASSLLPILDPSKTFSLFGELDPSSLKIFSDFNLKKIRWAEKKLNPAERSSFKSKPINELRIAIDPGHMGTDRWDLMTGKYVLAPNGQKLSEGLLNLQTALLLKQRFVKLGAKVLSTREVLKPVSSLNYPSFDLTPFAKNELRDNSLAPWFLGLLSKHDKISELISAFELSPERKRLFSERVRSEYFTKRADLISRTEKINNFNPDLVLIIHYDTSSSSNTDHSINPSSPNATKIFVPGAFTPTELSSNTQRTLFARKLLDIEYWHQSLSLSQKILKQMTVRLGTKPQIVQTPGKQVEPGIIARNFLMPRYLQTSAVAYIEALYYSRPEEFWALSDVKYPLMIDGKNYPYSERLKQVVDAIEAGVLDFAENK